MVGPGHAAARPVARQTRSASASVFEPSPGGMVIVAASSPRRAPCSAATRSSLTQNARETRALQRPDRLGGSLRRAAPGRSGPGTRPSPSRPTAAWSRPERRPATEAPGDTAERSGAQAGEDRVGQGFIDPSPISVKSPERLRVARQRAIGAPLLRLDPPPGDLRLDVQQDRQMALQRATGPARRGCSRRPARSPQPRRLRSAARRRAPPPAARKDASP